MKHTHRSYGGLLRFFVLCLLAATASGCLRGQFEVYARYDDGKDSFAYLCVFTDIQVPIVTLPPDYAPGRARLFPLRRPAVTLPADDPRHGAYLFALSQLKDELLIMPIRGILGPPAAYVRREDRMVHAVDLSQYPTGFHDKLKFPAPFQASVDVSSITIKPGPFFLNERKHLSYAHEIEVPSAVVDELLIVISKQLAQEILRRIDARRKADADPDSPQITWDQFREQLFSAAVGPLPLEPASLEHLRKAVAANELTIKRQGARLRLRMPLTQEDSKQLVATLDHVKKYVSTMIDKRQEEGSAGIYTAEEAKKMGPALKKALNDAVAYQVVAGQGVAIEVDLTKVFALMHLDAEILRRRPFTTGDAAADEKYERECARALDTLKNRGVEILAEFDVQKLRATYLSAGK